MTVPAATQSFTLQFAVTEYLKQHGELLSWVQSKWVPQHSSLAAQAAGFKNHLDLLNEVKDGKKTITPDQLKEFVSYIEAAAYDAGLGNHGLGEKIPPTLQGKYRYLSPMVNNAKEPLKMAISDLQQAIIDPLEAGKFVVITPAPHVAAAAKPLPTLSRQQKAAVELSVRLGGFYDKHGKTLESAATFLGQSGHSRCERDIKNLLAAAYLFCKTTKPLIESQADYLPDDSILLTARNLLELEKQKNSLAASHYSAAKSAYAEYSTLVVQAIADVKRMFNPPAPLLDAQNALGDSSVRAHIAAANKGKGVP